jgi:AraC-like DNA-binding protein
VYLDDRCPGPGQDGAAVTLFEGALLRVLDVRCSPRCAGAGEARTVLDTSGGSQYRVWLHRHAERCPARRHPAARAARSRHVERAQAYLAANYDQPLTLADIARAAQCSPFHLARLFRTELGTSLRRYQERLRFAAAIERLARGESDLRRLALDLGFPRHSHFTANFRRALGVTPTELRRTLSGPSARTILTAS